MREDWGWNFSEAGYYNGAVIEEVGEGFCNHSKKRWFFRHTKKKYKDGRVRLEEFKEPAYYKRIVGLTMG